MPKFIVLMEAELPTETKMKWGRCDDQEDVTCFKEIYSNLCPNATYEVYEVKDKVE